MTLPKDRLDLLPCPFCNGEAVRGRSDIPAIECRDCGASLHRYHKEDAYVAWNHRTSQPAEAQGGQELVAWEYRRRNAFTKEWMKWCPCQKDDYSYWKVQDGYEVRKLYRQPTVPEGYVIAPKEATQEMKAAGQAEINRLATDGIERYWQDVYGLGYKAMLAAAPSLPGSGG